MELTKPSGLVSQSVRPYVRPPWCRHLPLSGVDTYHSGVDTGVDTHTGCRHHHSVGVDTSVNTNISVAFQCCQLTATTHSSPPPFILKFFQTF